MWKAVTTVKGIESYKAILHFTLLTQPKFLLHNCPSDVLMGSLVAMQELALEIGFHR